MEFIYLIRIAFASLFSFEFLNSIKIFHIPLGFPWAGLALLSFLTWFSWEKLFKDRVDFSISLAGLVIFQLYVNTFGNVFKFYTKFSWYDKLTHFTGEAAVTTTVILILNYLNRKRDWKLKLNLLAVFGFSLSLTLAVFWELYEYFIDFSFHYSTVADKYDTSSDLLYGTIGAAIVTFLFTLIFKKEKSRPT